MGKGIFLVADGPKEVKELRKARKIKDRSIQKHVGLAKKELKKGGLKRKLTNDNVETDMDGSVKINGSNLSPAAKNIVNNTNDKANRKSGIQKANGLKRKRMKKMESKKPRFIAKQEEATLSDEDGLENSDESDSDAEQEESTLSEKTGQEISDEDASKYLRELYVVGLKSETTEDSLWNHFKQWGKIENVEIKTDPLPNRSRRYAYVTFSQEDMVCNALSAGRHRIDGKGVTVKRSARTQAQEAPKHLRKLFVGGLTNETTGDSLRNHFEQWGTVVNAVVKKDPNKRPRGFGFVTFSEEQTVDIVLSAQPHTINGKLVGVIRVKPDDELEAPRHLRKLFVGGLTNETTNDSLKNHFEQWGTVVDAVVKQDHVTKRSRGFGFVTFSEVQMVDKAQSARPHTIDGKLVGTLRMKPKGKRRTGIPDESNYTLFIPKLVDIIKEEDLQEYFSQFGNVVSVKIVADKQTGKKLGLVSFDDHDPVDKVLLKRHNIIKGQSLGLKTLSSERQLNLQGQGGGRNNFRGGPRPRRRNYHSFENPVLSTSTVPNTSDLSLLNKRELLKELAAARKEADMYKAQLERKKRKQEQEKQD